MSAGLGLTPPKEIAPTSNLGSLALSSFIAATKGSRGYS